VQRQHLIVGGPERCAREIAALQEATGLTHLSVQPTWEGLPHDLACASLRRFGEAVIPHLR
jgi:alkanesulfonate monooxygenase SsuD/methylene tetrahydromethanopterin reductase-like flavin-dependent oxidoreductase (luciferase family)